MEESIDVKALRKRFNNQASNSDNSSRDSGSPKSPRPGFGRAILPALENELAHRLSPTVPPPGAVPGQVRFPRPEGMAASIPPRLPSFPRQPPFSPVRASIQSADTSRVKQTGEKLQNMMLRNQRPPGPVLGLAPAPSSAQGPAKSPTATPLPLRHQPRQKSTGDVIPLRKPLPPEGPMPLKPRRPPNVNLEPFLRAKQRPALPVRVNSDGSAGRRMSSPGVVAPEPPLRTNKPSTLPLQVADPDLEDEQDTYDDIGLDFDKNESHSDNSFQHMDDDDDDEVYEFIDEDQLEINRLAGEMKNRTDMRRHELDKNEHLGHQKKMNEVKKRFQLQGEVEVLHIARVRHDWHGEGKLDLGVRQGERVEILRVKNNPGGKWLARSLGGNYGYISNACVDVDYNAIKSDIHKMRKTETSELPPPPPDPHHMFRVDTNNRNSMLEDDDDYDDVQPLPEEFPPPPVEISLDPKVEKELKKKFKYEGPVRVLHSMMVDPNCIIKKLGSKDLPVTQGEVVDVIQVTNSKKVLCRNRFGKYGYVSRAILLPMEGDVYDDVDYGCDIYDNDSPHADY
ncbi:FYN-binding protein 1 isoform X2 [Cololabis saira]|uniref:FYN-binding protein 1 isoform X2 n=1 Tax=Cololabis saira TaxID=129043 RepID=UPI002AD49D64|nr:FYN-binding protein 1 isoform X2 [Cololabis saira]